MFGSSNPRASQSGFSQKQNFQRENNQFNRPSTGGFSSNSDTRTNPRSGGGFNQKSNNSGFNQKSSGGFNPRSSGGGFSSKSSGGGFNPRSGDSYTSQRDSNQQSSINKVGGPKYGGGNAQSSIFGNNNPRAATNSFGSQNWGSSSQSNPRASSGKFGVQSSKESFNENPRQSNYESQDSRTASFQSENKGIFGQSNPRSGFNNEKQGSFFGKQSNQNPRSSQKFDGNSFNDNSQSSYNQRQGGIFGAQDNSGGFNPRSQTGTNPRTQSSFKGFNKNPSISNMEDDSMVNDSNFRGDKRGFNGNQKTNPRSGQASYSKHGDRYQSFNDESQYYPKSKQYRTYNEDGGMDTGNDQRGSGFTQYKDNRDQFKSEQKGSIFGQNSAQARSGGIFGNNSAMNNREKDKLDAMLSLGSNDIEQSSSIGVGAGKEGSKIDPLDNPDPPKINITPATQLLMKMGFECFMSKPYSDENNELIGESVISYEPPTLDQVK